MRQPKPASLGDLAWSLLVSAIALYTAARLVAAVWPILAAIAVMAVSAAVLRAWWLHRSNW